MSSDEGDVLASLDDNVGESAALDINDDIEAPTAAAAADDMVIADADPSSVAHQAQDAVAAASEPLQQVESAAHSASEGQSDAASPAAQPDAVSAPVAAVVSAQTDAASAAASAPGSAPANSETGAPLRKGQTLGSVKLFIGQLPYTYNDEQVRAMLQPYGTVTDILLMHHPDTGRPKGCGFVWMGDKATADAAIEAINGKVVLLSPERPVKLAYAQTHENGAAGGKPAGPGGGGMGGRGGGAAGGGYGPPMGRGGGRMGAPGGMGGPGGMFGGMNASAMAQAAMAALGAMGGHPGAMMGGGGHHMGGHMGGGQFGHMGHHGGHPMHHGGGMDPMALAALQMGVATLGGFGGMPGMGPGGHMGGMGGGPMGGGGRGGMGGGGGAPRPRAEGPPGANLYIRNVPPHFNDDALAATFAPFGQLLQSSVPMDRATGAPRGFGFVSFAAPASAAAAIASMDGAMIGGRRLGVQIKTPGGGAGGPMGGAGAGAPGAGSMGPMTRTGGAPGMGQAAPPAAAPGMVPGGYPAAPVGAAGSGFFGQPGPGAYGYPGYSYPMQ